MRLVPLGDRVVLKQVVAEETTKSGIVLPGQTKEKPQQAEVVAVGPNVEDLISVGDKVIYAKFAGTEVELDGANYLVMKQEDILAIIKQVEIQEVQAYGKRNLVWRRSQKSIRSWCK